MAYVHKKMQVEIDWIKQHIFMYPLQSVFLYSLHMAEWRNSDVGISMRSWSGLNVARYNAYFPNYVYHWHCLSIWIRQLIVKIRE